jgi:hypothetical protein
MLRNCNLAGTYMLRNCNLAGTYMLRKWHSIHDVQSPLVHEGLELNFAQVGGGLPWRCMDHQGFLGDPAEREKSSGEVDGLSKGPAQRSHVPSATLRRRSYQGQQSIDKYTCKGTAAILTPENLPCSAEAQRC